MLTPAEEVILQKWHDVRNNATKADRLIGNPARIEHALPTLVAACDAEIAKLEAKR